MAEPVLRVVRGDATAEEIAALVAVLAAAGSAASQAGRATRRGDAQGRGPRRVWSDRSARLRRPFGHGQDAWRMNARRGVM